MSETTDLGRVANDVMARHMSRPGVIFVSWASLSDYDKACYRRIGDDIAAAVADTVRDQARREAEARYSGLVEQGEKLAVTWGHFLAAGDAARIELVEDMREFFTLLWEARDAALDAASGATEAAPPTDPYEVMGKFAHVPISSDEFAARKHRDPGDESLVTRPSFPVEVEVASARAGAPLPDPGTVRGDGWFAHVSRSDDTHEACYGAPDPGDG